jgi:hypothetical protein
VPLIYGTLRWLASIIDSVGQNNSRDNTASRYIDDGTLMQLRREHKFSFGAHNLSTSGGKHSNWCAWNGVNARLVSAAGLLTHVLCVKDASQSSGKTSLHTHAYLRPRLAASRQRSCHEMRTVCEDSGSHGTSFQDYYIMGCDVSQFGGLTPEFRITPLLPSSE